MCRKQTRYFIVFIGLLFTLCSVKPVYAHHFIIQGLDNKKIEENIQERLDLGQKQAIYSGQNAVEHIKRDTLEAMQPFGYYRPNIRLHGKTLFIQKGPPVRIHQIQLTINGPGRHIYSRVHMKLPIEVNKIFNSERYEKAKQMLFNIAEQHGYLKSTMVKSEAIVDLKKMQATIIIHFNTGKPYYFGYVNFSKTSYDEAFLRRYLNFNTHTPYSTDKVLNLNNNLNSSGYFNQVTVKPDITDSQYVPIQITLQPKPSQYYSIGGGYGTDTGLRGRLGVHLLQITPTGHTLQALAQGSQKQNSLQTQYNIPGPNPVTQHYNLTANIFTLNYPVGHSDGQLLSAGFVFNTEKTRYTANLNALNERFQYVGRNTQKSNFIYPSLHMLTRKVNNLLFSKKGYSIEIQAQGASDAIVSTESFLQGRITAKAAYWLPSHTRLLARATLGHTAVSQLYHLPISLQLLAGGADTVRGYNYQSIGPGRKEVIMSGEVQQEIIKNWFIVGYFDRGAVYDPLKRAYKRGIGAGVMWASPLGPISLSLARALDRPGRPFKVVINMGPDL